MAGNAATWRSTYLLGVALILPIGTLVLVSYYFTRVSSFTGQANPWAFHIIAIAGGLSAIMATLVTLFAGATYRARVRFENEYRNLQRYLNDDVAKERTRMIRSLDLASAAQQVSMAIKQDTDFQRILSVVLEQLEHFSRADTISVFTLDDHSHPVVRAERRNGIDRFPPQLAADGVERSLVDDAARAGRPVRSLNEATGEFVLAVYFATPEGVRGVVRVARNVADDVDFRDEMPAFEQAVGQLVRMVSLGLKTASIWDRAIKDEKTGLYNANHYAEQMRKYAAQARRSGQPLALIMLDIDKFKHVNDTYGHLAGDKVLAQVAQLLMREARESDTPFRYGGEELCVICAATTAEEAALAAERMRQVIACTEFHDDRGRLLPVSASFGVAQFDPEAMATEKDLKELCDQALYHGKQNGRNVVVLCNEPGRFRVIERGGNVELEVKRRLGLAGDNSPLHPDAAEQPVVADSRAASARAQLGESIDKLATGIADVVGNDSERARVVDTVLREATEFLTRNLSARLSGRQAAASTASGTAAPEPVPAAADPGPSRRKRAPRKRKEASPPVADTATNLAAKVLAAGTGSESPAAEPAPDAPVAEAAPAPGPSRRKRAPRKKKDPAVEQAKALLAAVGHQPPADAAAADSDRLDYLTESEGRELQ
ncbi:MAG: GGDEF domain-containing protein, partial [Planctomycetes bacterium]|nr:GGDEF domain-containing protein [Planctomycetota bacterium]